MGTLECTRRKGEFTITTVRVSFVIVLVVLLGGYAVTLGQDEVLPGPYTDVDETAAVQVAKDQFACEYNVGPNDVVLLDVSAYASRYNDDLWWMIKLGNRDLSVRQLYAVSASDGHISRAWNEVEAHEKEMAKQAGKIHPILQQQIADKDPEQEVGVIVVLKDQPNIGRLLKKAIRKAKKQSKNRCRKRYSGQEETAKEEKGRSYLLKMAAQFNKSHGQRRVKRFITKRLGGEVVSLGSLRNSIVAKIPVGALAGLVQLRQVAEIQPELELVGHLDTSVPSVGIYPSTWDNYTSGNDNPSFDIDIGIMDSGVDGTHPALDVHRSENFDTVETASTDDNQGHGTHAAGVTSSQDPIYTGVAYDSRLWNLKVAHRTGTGDVSSSSSSVGPALEFAYLRHVEVVNYSYGHLPPDPADYASTINGSLEHSRAYDAYVEAGLIATISAGNDGPRRGSLHAPADAYNVIAVGAMSHEDDTDRSNDVVAAASSRGPTGDGRTKPDIVAVGFGIHMPWYLHETEFDFAYNGGTSFAAPHVAGVAALMIDHWAKKYGERLAGRVSIDPTGGVLAPIEGGPLLVRSLLYVGADESYGQHDDTSFDDFRTGTGYMHGGKTLAFTDKAYTWVTNMDDGQRRRRFLLGTVGFPDPPEPIWTKAAITWNRHVADMETHTPLAVSDIDLELRDASGTVLNASCDMVTNWEKVRAEDANRNSPGIFRVDIYGNSVPSEVGTETVALAADKYILPPWPNRSFNKDPYIDAIIGRRTDDDTFTWYVAQSDGDGFAAISEWGAGFAAGDAFFTGDFDGDGHTDLGWVQKSPLVSSYLVEWNVARSHGSSFGDGSLWGNALFVWPDPPGGSVLHFFPGDFNGDGSTDIATAQVFDDTTVTWYVSRSLSPSAGNTFADSSMWISDFGDAGDQFFVGDFNGDGRADVAAGSEIAGEMSWNVATSNGTGFVDEGLWRGVFGSPDDQFFAGDFNGDGLTDMAHTSSPLWRPWVSWWVAASDGEAFQEAQYWGFHDAGVDDEFLVGDFNGDGWTDLAYVERRPSGGLRWHVAKSADSGAAAFRRWGDFGEEGDMILK